MSDGRWPDDRPTVTIDDVTPQQVGGIARLLRHRQHLRQVDVAHRAQVSRLTVMRLEAGDAGRLTLDGIAAAFQALGGRIDLRPFWQGAALDRLLDEGHARLSGRVVEILGRHGWETRVEVTFSVYGDRGSIDILAWHAASRTLLVVEIKTELGSVDGLLRRSTSNAGWRATSDGNVSGRKPLGSDGWW